MRLPTPPPPLLDRRGRPFHFSITDRILQHVLRAEGGASDPLGLVGHSPGMERRYLVSSLIEEAIHSSRLEGAATTRAVARRMLRDGRRPRDHGERMIADNYRTIEMPADLPASVAAGPGAGPAQGTSSG